MYIYEDASPPLVIEMPVNDWEGAYTLAFFRNLFDFFDLIIWIRLFVA